MRAIDADHLKRWILSRVFRTQLNVSDVIDQIDREDAIESQQRWIPCSERLPDEDHHIVNGIYRSDIVFVTVVNHDADDDTFTDMAVLRNCEWQLYHPDDGDADIPKWCEVTAWMPLPEPYKGVKNG